MLRRRKAKNDFGHIVYNMTRNSFERLFLAMWRTLYHGVYDYQDGVIRRLAVSMPPRAGKSYILVVHRLDARSLRKSRSCATAVPIRCITSCLTTARHRPFFRFKEISQIQLRGDKQNVHGWSLEAARQVSTSGRAV